jgi:CCR4-NOT transcriptional regulation complex NOT5 subunit
LQERFKECEKEAKMKPFAKAALAGKGPERVDPAVQAKLEAHRWLNRAVTTLAEQVEHFEVLAQSRILYCT